MESMDKRLGTVISLFDGMSCGQLALNDAGIEYDIYCASEIDEPAIKVTQHNFKNTRQMGSVEFITKHNFPNRKIDLLMGGSPCQDLRPGKGGLNGDRSRLFYEYYRVFKELDPKYFLLENVGKISNEDKNIISNLLGVSPQRINSNSFSAQNRDRFYWTNICNKIYLPENTDTLKSILEDQVENNYYVGPIHSGNYIEGNQLNPKYRSQANTIHDINKKSPTLCAFTHGYAQGYIRHLGRFRRLTPLEFERLQTVPDNYTEIVSDTQRYKMLGNGWTVKVISAILKQIP